MAKRTTSFALEPEALELLRAVADQMGLSLTATVQTLIRNRARREGLRPKATSQPTSPAPQP